MFLRFEGGNALKTSVSFTAGRNLKWLVPLLTLVLLADAANAQQCLSVPDEFPGIPAYGRGVATRGVPTSDSVWCASVWYRPPQCVPNNFNLLMFADFGLFDPSRAAECPFLMEGFMTWDDGKRPLCRPTLLLGTA